LLVRLADGRLHSGESLAAQLGVTRTAVWKGVERLRNQGIEVHAVARRGYRLAQPVELLDTKRIRAALEPGRLRYLRDIELLFDVDSTNTRLLSAPPPPRGRADACLAELQRAGRGRRGRRWVAPFGASIALSLGWYFGDTVRDLPALSLAVGVAVARALARAGASGITLKWPNDVWFKDRKLAGVLIELKAEASGPAHVVIGVGLNTQLPAAARRQIEATGVCVAAAADACAEPPSRNLLAGVILDELLSMLVQFEREGFAPFCAAWSKLDALNGRQARVVLGEQEFCGIAKGVDAHGALLLSVGGRMRSFVSGEASLHLQGKVT
jgi:BirA family biotin operon repressor/biotin-[acetyl-CoA-carboxylase] ligase